MSENQLVAFAVFEIVLVDEVIIGLDKVAHAEKVINLRSENQMRNESRGGANRSVVRNLAHEFPYITGIIRALSIMPALIDTQVFGHNKRLGYANGIEGCQDGGKQQGT